MLSSWQHRALPWTCLHAGAQSRHAYTPSSQALRPALRQGSGGSGQCPHKPRWQEQGGEREEHQLWSWPSLSRLPAVHPALTLGTLPLSEPRSFTAGAGEVSVSRCHAEGCLEEGD